MFLYNENKEENMLELLEEYLQKCKYWVDNYNDMIYEEQSYTNNYFSLQNERSNKEREIDVLKQLIEFVNVNWRINNPNKKENYNEN